jgi:hypothetical protein
MKKLILAGGYLHKAADGGKAFFHELSKDIPASPVKILDCMFARPQSSWLAKLEEDKLLFSKYIGPCTVTLADTANFIDQIESADLVFFRGGDTPTLLEQLRECGNWLEALDDKTVAGTSAGAEIFAKYVYDIDRNIIIPYLSVLPIKLITHWKSDYNAPNVNWDEALAQLKAHQEELELVTLAEGEFRVF